MIFFNETEEIFDIVSITREEAEMQYVDYKTGKHIGFTLYKHSEIIETINATKPLEEVKTDMLLKYGWREWQFKIMRCVNQVKLAFLIPDINQNVDTIIKDMEYYGYFKGYETSKIIYGLKYKELRFEPYFQDSVRNNVINTGVIYHSTHNSNIENIKKNGLIPSSKNKIFKYPNRTYFSKFTSNMQKICTITEHLAIVSGRNVKDYSILSIDTTKIPDNVDFFLDGSYSNGIFTEDVIPSECIFLIESFEDVAKRCNYKLKKNKLI